MASGENEFDTPALKDVSVAHVIYCHCNSLTGKTKSTNNVHNDIILVKKINSHYSHIDPIII